MTSDERIARVPKNERVPRYPDHKRLPRFYSELTGDVEGLPEIREILEKHPHLRTLILSKLNVKPEDQGGLRRKVDVEPPGVAEFLLEIFLTSTRGQALIGDMSERFGCDCVELGRKRAVRRYWAHTVRTLLPMLRRAIARAIKWGALVDAFWRHWHG